MLDECMSPFFLVLFLGPRGSGSSSGLCEDFTDASLQKIQPDVSRSLQSLQRRARTAHRLHHDSCMHPSTIPSSAARLPSNNSSIIPQSLHRRNSTSSPSPSSFRASLPPLHTLQLTHSSFVPSPSSAPTIPASPNNPPNHRITSPSSTPPSSSMKSPTQRPLTTLDLLKSDLPLFDVVESVRWTR